MHPTRMHGYIFKWNDGGATDNNKDGGNDTVKINFAEMDVKSASENMVSKFISMCIAPN